MRPYIGIVHKDRDSAYGITFPDAPGCFSAADDLDDLFAQATEALQLWADFIREHGERPPPTRDLSAIKMDPSWAESFGDAALVIAVPPPGSTSQKAA